MNTRTVAERAADSGRKGHQETRSPADARIDPLVKRGLPALEEYAAFDQETIDRIVSKASVAALSPHGLLARHAVEETGRGVFEDKATKNLVACEHVTNSMKRVKTVGVIHRDELNGIIEIAEQSASSPGSPPSPTRPRQRSSSRCSH